MVTIFEAVVEPTRRQILDLLRERPRMVGELVAALAVSQPNISKHLRVLREAGLVVARRQAQQREYALRAEPLAEIEVWLAPYRQLWEARYNRLDMLLAEMQEQETPHDEP